MSIYEVFMAYFQTRRALEGAQSWPQVLGVRKANVRLILAPHLAVGANPRPPITWDELVRHGEVEVPSDSEATVHDIVSRVIGEQRSDLVGVEPQIDAPGTAEGLV
ncbi:MULTISPECIES: hypothetical protein, partial [unclassified Nocardioides]|uniref:hypothetical protein n=1 Tax=unclassified Nocardioides TaxID=2615069 RepID=UPI0009F0FA50